LKPKIPLGENFPSIWNHSQCGPFRRFDHVYKNSHEGKLEGFLNKKHLKNVGPIRHCEQPHAACFTLQFTRCHYCRTPPVHRCPQQHRQQRQRVTEGTAMAPWNGPNKILPIIVLRLLHHWKHNLPLRLKWCCICINCVCVCVALCHSSYDSGLAIKSLQIDSITSHFAAMQQPSTSKFTHMPLFIKQYQLRVVILGR